MVKMKITPGRCSVEVTYKKCHLSHFCFSKIATQTQKVPVSGRSMIMLNNCMGIGIEHFSYSIKSKEMLIFC